MDDCSLNKVNSAKYLGVIIDHKLNWIDHIAYIKNKISKGIGIMYRARNFLNKSSLIGLYYSYIYPYFTYCLETWGCAFKNTTKSFVSTPKKNNTYNDVFALPSTHRTYI